MQSLSLYYLHQGVEQTANCTRSQLRDTVEWVDVTANAIHQEKAWEPTRGNGCLTCAFAKACSARTGEVRTQTPVWQQGDLLWEMNTAEPATQQETTPILPKSPSATTEMQMTLDDYL